MSYKEESAAALAEGFFSGAAAEQRYGFTTKQDDNMLPRVARMSAALRKPRMNRIHSVYR